MFGFAFIAVSLPTAWLLIRIGYRYIQIGAIPVAHPVHAKTVLIQAENIMDK